jgi:DNA-binding CsgD family transcriptional regulator
MSFIKCKKLNQLSIRLLDRLGNPKPVCKQIKLMESLLTRVDIEHKLYLDNQLTGQERSCLLLAAKGKTTKATAKLLGIEVSTVRSYHKSIKYKLSCSTIAQAVFEGIRYGYMELGGKATRELKAE